MITILDQVVGDWGFKSWYSEGRVVKQVKVCLFNGMILMMDLDDFIKITDDGIF